MQSLKKLRWFHLLLALAAAAAYFTGEMGGGGHRLIGYTVAALLTLRLLLSLAGGGSFGWRRWMPPTHAPAAMRGLKHLAISRVLVLAILLCTAGAATTGVLMDEGRALANPSFSFGDGEDGEEGEGRDDDEARQSLPHGVSHRPVVTAGIGFARIGGEGEEEGDDEEGPLGEIHELFANLLLPLVGLHIAYLLLFRLSLAKFMLFWPTRKSAA